MTEMMERNLKAQGMDWSTVLEAGRTCQLHAVANISGGGDSEDVTERLHPGFAEIAINIRRAVPGMLYTGINLLADDITADPAGQDWAICEINGTPDFGLHHFPVHGQPRDVAGALVELALGRPAPKSAAPRKAVEVLIEGKVTGVGYRKWCQGMCGIFNVSGWIRNQPDGSVVASFSGTEAAVDHMLKLCKVGPKDARPERITAEVRTDLDESPAFDIR